MKMMMTRLLAVAALCLTSSAAQAVTYTLSKGDLLDFTWTTDSPISNVFKITDFSGKTCELGDADFRLPCTSLTINPFYRDEESGSTAEVIRMFASQGGWEMYSDLYLETGSLGRNGTYTGWRNNLTLTVAGIGTSPAPASPVPEPATWALMLAGFGLTGAALRRRRRAVTRVLA